VRDSHRPVTPEQIEPQVFAPEQIEAQVIAPEQNPPDGSLSFVIAVSLWTDDAGTLQALVTEQGDTQPVFVPVPAQFAAMLPTVLSQLRSMKN
jgi:hypothetical protein